MAAQSRTATAVDRKGLSGPALRAFFHIAELWSLSVEEQMTLLGLTASVDLLRVEEGSENCAAEGYVGAHFLHSGHLQGTFSFYSPTSRRPTNG